jgi:hypothetical protein
MSFLDIDDEPAPALPVVATSDSVREYDAAYSRLSDSQKKFLLIWPSFHYNTQRTCRTIGINQSTVSRWRTNEDYALVVGTMRAEVAKEILDKNRLVLVQEECVQSLLTDKPVLHQGIPVMHDGKILMEVEAAAAAKIVESQLKVGGHLKEDMQQGGFTLPQLVVQVTNRIGGEVEKEIIVGVIPPTPELIPDWLDDGT